MAERLLPEIVIQSDPSKRSPGLIPTRNGTPIPLRPAKQGFPLPAAPMGPKPTAAGKVTGLLLTAVVWGGLAALAAHAFRSVRGKR